MAVKTIVAVKSIKQRIENEQYLRECRFLHQIALQFLFLGVIRPLCTLYNDETNNRLSLRNDTCCLVSVIH